MEPSDLPLNLLSRDRKELIRQWGFNCTCSLCSSHAKTVDSDSRRQRITEVLEQMHLPENKRHRNLGRLAQEIVDLGEKEGMLPQIGDFHHIIGELYNEVGDTRMAREHGNMALEQLKHFAGFDNERTLKASRFLLELG